MNHYREQIIYEYRSDCALSLQNFYFFLPVFSESRTQTSDGSLRDDGHGGIGRMGRLEADGKEEAVVFDRRRSGTARVA